VTAELRVCAPGDWAASVAGRLVAAIEAHPTLRLCLPTGATPRPLYHELAARCDLTAATVVVLDEFGGLPVDDPARCDTMIRRDLLDRLAAPPAAVLHLDPDAEDLDMECRRFDHEVAAGGLDLVLVGIGMNGHIGLNEPGSGPASPTRRVELAETTRQGAAAYGAASPPSWGLTLGLDRILEAREVWLLATGPGKADVLREALEGPITPRLPASLLRSHPRLVVLADEAAAAGLAQPAEGRSG
jgi:glucosamine-6-phosphate deaminase